LGKAKRTPVGVLGLLEKVRRGAFSRQVFANKVNRIGKTHIFEPFVIISIQIWPNLNGILMRPRGTLA
jgi:hypothetical protein